MTMAGAGQAAGDAAVACPSSVDVGAKTSTRFHPSLVSGDGEFHGHGPAVVVSAKRERIDAAADFLRVTVRMRADETRADWTRADGVQQTFTLYMAPQGCNIDPSSLTLGAFDANGYLARAMHSDPYHLAPGNTGLNPSFVQGYTVWDDQVGLDVPGYTSVQVTTRPFTVRFIP